MLLLFHVASQRICRHAASSGAKIWSQKGLLLRFLLRNSFQRCPFSYINFLVVIQAVEGYGRRYLKKEIAAYRNNLPQGRKSRPLLEILQTIFKHFSDVQKINQKTDLEAIVQTRNYHSHLLPQKNPKTVDVLDLYDLTDELRKVLLCCILSYLGLTNREIDDLTRQSHNGLFQK